MHSVRYWLPRRCACLRDGRARPRRHRRGHRSWQVAKLAGGDLSFYEAGLRKMLSDNIAVGRLRFTTDYDAATDFADLHFLGVGTPQKKGEYGADLRHVHAVIDTLVPRLKRSAVIVGKSTVLVSTAAELGERARALAPEGVDVEVACNSTARRSTSSTPRRWRTRSACFRH